MESISNFLLSDRADLGGISIEGMAAAMPLALAIINQTSISIEAINRAGATLRGDPDDASS